MERIAIIGSSGAGKTTLAKKLGSRLGMKVYHLDRLFWRYGWERKDRETRIDILQKLLQEKQWIIDGTYLNSSELHLIMADTIIFSDPPSLNCLLHLIKRHMRDHGQSRRDIPEGCKNKLSLFQILKVQTFPLKARRKIQQKLHTYGSKKIILLRSKNEIEDFLESTS